MKPTRLVAQAFGGLLRSGRTFAAVRALRRDMRRGIAPDASEGLSRLAAAMQVDHGLVKDVLLRTHSGEHGAREHLAVARALAGASRFALLSPATGRALGQMQQNASAASRAQMRSLGVARKHLQVARHNNQVELTYAARRGNTAATGALARQQAKLTAEVRQVTAEYQLLARSQPED